MQRFERNVLKNTCLYLLLSGCCLDSAIFSDYGGNSENEDSVQLSDTNIQFSVYYLNTHQHAEINFFCCCLMPYTNGSILETEEVHFCSGSQESCQSPIKTTGCASFGSGWAKGLVRCCSRSWLKKQCQGDTFCTNGEISKGHQETVSHHRNGKKKPTKPTVSFSHGSGE